MRTSFSASNTESDVEQFFIYPLLVDNRYLAIPESYVRTKPSLAAHDIGKGTSRKRYVPDYLVYSEGIPCLVIEAKNPEENLSSAYSECQLYALEINKKFPEGANPCQWVCATNGREIWVGSWDSAKPKISHTVEKIVVGGTELSQLQTLVGWDKLVRSSEKINRSILPQHWTFPSEHLGENRVTLAKAGHNSLYRDLEPLLRRYFDPKDREMEDEIIEKAYVNTEDRTKYERTFEDFLRTRVIPFDEQHRASEIKTSRRTADGFTSALKNITESSKPFMQLIIGGVGSGKTTFIRRYFEHVIDADLSEKIVYCRLDLNIAPENLDGLEDWVSQRFIENFREKYINIVDPDTSSGLNSIFSKEIKNNAGAYSYLKKSSPEKYNERLGTDLLGWMEDPKIFAKALARCLSGDRGYTVLIAFDNVDRRQRDSQLKIFQVGQWFMNETKSVCLMTLRDETFETYKDEKPLDAFLKTGNFYIRPPRFVDMVSKRLHLAISEIGELGNNTNSYDIAGIGTIKYPVTAVGQYLTSIYVDLFKKKRRITLVLEGLAGRNARKSLEMFVAALTSAHFDTRDFTQSILTMGSYSIQEAVLIRALMRTNYLYFMPAHGFIRNIYDFPIESEKPSHFLKSEILRFLIDNRKKRGDTRYEGYFTVQKIEDVMESKGFFRGDIVPTINSLVADELLITERLTLAKVTAETAIRVHPSGYIHLNILAERVEYVASCSLVTPVSDRELVTRIGERWQISDTRNDARSKNKRDAAIIFLGYLKKAADVHRGLQAGVADAERIGATILKKGDDALGFKLNKSPEYKSDETEFERLFNE